MKIRKPVFYFWILLLIISGCNNSQAGKEINYGSTPQILEQQPKKVHDTITKHWSVEDFYSTDSILLREVDNIYNSMDVNERAAQLIMAGTGRSKAFGLPFAKIMQLYKSKVIGGVLFLKGTRNLFKEEVKKINLASVNGNILPSIFSCDCEPTLFHKKFTDADSMQATSELKTAQDVKKSAAAISNQMHQIGIQWNFAPVADVGINEEIINKRSFGNDTQQVIRKSIAFINSSTDSNIVTTIKHFPGHGAVKGDSHRQLVYIDSVLTELENFKSIIKLANPISVMIGHIAVENNETYNTNGMPSSLSKKIITTLLKINIGFKGIIVSDAMNMGAVKNIPNADYLAILAGNDIVVMPQDAQLLHKKLVRDLLSNSVLKNNLVNSVKKILKLKICLGLIGNFKQATNSR